jgi:hypothetical protein
VLGHDDGLVVSRVELDVRDGEVGLDVNERAAGCPELVSVTSPVHPTPIAC